MSLSDLNAVNYDGTTSETSFDYNNPPNSVTQSEVALLKVKHAKTFDLLTKVRIHATALLDVLDKARPIINSIQANGLKSRVDLPPFPLPGELAPLTLQMLAPGLVAFSALETFLGTPIPISGGTVTPITIFRQISN